MHVGWKVVIVIFHLLFLTKKARIRCVLQASLGFTHAIKSHKRCLHRLNIREIGMQKVIVKSS